ncbi:CRISPR-associated protein Csx19 [Argonema antarcticum]|uniref:type III-D CRISPR-associated protein Csx19 n=1 Tax=Argonema antarcticum TaxID=2942763 RepID=UPI0020128622|nr:CRISPR-associated protein Csx19 [Argonema antarcticum]MCL1473248.1 TIGR03984 family CRISPR-associated protein [Argonema antarcticum A004/B2]
MKPEIITDCGERQFASNDALKKWLTDYHLTYLLAHADDGVIWGRFDNGKLTIANEVFTKPDFYFPPLRLSTLQQCRIFGQQGEVLLWKYGEKWKWRFIGNPQEDFIPESQILWGTQLEEEPKNGFTLVSDGSQGLKHAVPLINIPFSPDKKNLYRPIRLEVRHYIDYDDSGVAKIYLSRLVDLRGT